MFVFACEVLNLKHFHHIKLNMLLDQNCFITVTVKHVWTHGVNHGF